MSDFAWFRLHPHRITRNRLKWFQAYECMVREQREPLWLGAHQCTPHCPFRQWIPTLWVCPFTGNVHVCTDTRCDQLIQTHEHRICPWTLQLYAREFVSQMEDGKCFTSESLSSQQHEMALEGQDMAIDTHDEASAEVSPHKPAALSTKKRKATAISKRPPLTPEAAAALAKRKRQRFTIHPVAIEETPPPTARGTSDNDALLKDRAAILGCVEHLLGFMASRVAKKNVVPPVSIIKPIAAECLRLWGVIRSMPCFPDNNSVYPINLHCLVVLLDMVKGVMIHGRAVLASVAYVKAIRPDSKDLAQRLQIRHCHVTNGLRFFRRALHEAYKAVS